MNGQEWQDISDAIITAWPRRVDESWLGLLRQDLDDAEGLTGDEVKLALGKHRRENGDHPPSASTLIAYAKHSRSLRREKDDQSLLERSKCPVCLGRGLIDTVGHRFKAGRAIMVDVEKPGMWLWRCTCEFGAKKGEGILVLTASRREQLLSPDIGHVFADNRLNIMFDVFNAPVPSPFTEVTDFDYDDYPM